jgi:hypothetical protein
MSEASRTCPESGRSKYFFKHKAGSPDLWVIESGRPYELKRGSDRLRDSQRAFDTHYKSVTGNRVAVVYFPDPSSDAGIIFSTFEDFDTFLDDPAPQIEAVQTPELSAMFAEECGTPQGSPDVWDSLDAARNKVIPDTTNCFTRDTFARRYGLRPTTASDQLALLVESGAVERIARGRHRLLSNTN